MSSKPTTGARVMDARPGSSSGVFSARPGIGLHSDLAAAIASGEVRPVGDRDWYKVQMNIAKGAVGIGAFAGTPIPPDDHLAAMYSEDLTDVATFNRAAGGIGERQFQAILASVNKSEFFERAAAVGLALPMVESTDRGLDGVREILSRTSPAECVVKPRSGTGSIGVFRGKTHDADSFLRQLSSALKGMSDQHNLVVMGVVDNGKAIKELAVNAVVIDGVVAFAAVHSKIQQTMTAPFRDFLMVTELNSEAMQIKLDRLLPRVISALDLDYGVVQLEVRPDANDDWIPIDISTRPDGGLIPDSIQAVWGLDLRLAQIYAQSGKVELLRQHLRECVKPASGSAAIGAFYGSDLSQSSVDQIMRAVKERRVGDIDIFSIYCQASLSNLPIAPSEVQASLCVVGSSPSDAVSRLLSSCNGLSLQSGSAWVNE